MSNFTRWIELEGYLSRIHDLESNAATSYSFPPATNCGSTGHKSIEVYPSSYVGFHVAVYPQFVVGQKIVNETVSAIKNSKSWKGIVM
jgi:hypothetical protein